MPEPPRPDPPNNHARVTLFGLYPPTRWANVFWLAFNSNEDPSFPVLDAIADEINTAYINAFLPNLSTNVEYAGCEIVYYADDGPIRVQADSAGTGDVTDGVALPANVACCISWKVAASYRGGHPRTYLPGIMSDFLDDVSRFNATFQAAILSSASTFRGAVNGIAIDGFDADIELGTMSFVNDKAWRTPPVFRRYIGESIDGRVDTQRRRLGRDVAI